MKRILLLVLLLLMLTGCEYGYNAKITTQVGNQRYTTTCKYRYKIVDGELVYTMECE